MGNQPPSACSCCDERSTRAAARRDPIVAPLEANSAADRTDSAAATARSPSPLPLSLQSPSHPAAAAAAPSTSTPIMKIPKYHGGTSPPGHLLTLSWSRDWSSVIERCSSHPSEAYAVNDRGRTALHLSMFGGAPPLEATLALLAANKHASVVRDRSGSTPLHYACRFGGGNGPGGGRKGDYDECEDEEAKVIGILCHSAIDVERSVTARAAAFASLDAQHASAEEWSSPLHLHHSVVATTLDGGGPVDPRTESPLYLACRRNASIGTLRALIEAASLVEDDGAAATQRRRRARSSWIAPPTGAEPWWVCRDDERDCDAPANGGGGGGDDLDLSPLRAVVNRFSRLLRDQEEDGGGGDAVVLALGRVLRRRAAEEGACAAETVERCRGDDRRGGSSDADADAIRNAQDLWDKMLLLLEAGRRAQRRISQPGERTAPPLRRRSLLRPLHAAAALVDPLPPLVDLALALSPDDVLARDEDRGMIPLHHALSAMKPLSSSNSSLLTMHGDSAAVIASLLNARPEAAAVPLLLGEKGEGEHKKLLRVLPLHYALSRGLLDWSAVLGPLVTAAPESLFARDPETGLFPFMLAAAVACRSSSSRSDDGGDDDDEEEVSAAAAKETDAVYRLLRACPQNVSAR